MFLPIRGLKAAHRVQTSKISTLKNKSNYYNNQIYQKIKSIILQTNQQVKNLEPTPRDSV